MTDKEKKQAAAFTKDKGIFAGNSPEKKDDTQQGQRKQPGAHQPRDGNTARHQKKGKTGQDTASGQNDRKAEPEKTSGQGDQKPPQKNVPQKKRYQTKNSSGQSDKMMEDGKAAHENKNDFSTAGNAYTPTADENQEEQQTAWQ